MTEKQELCRTWPVPEPNGCVERSANSARAGRGGGVGKGGGDGWGKHINRMHRYVDLVQAGTCLEPETQVDIGLLGRNPPLLGGGGGGSHMID